MLRFFLLALMLAALSPASAGAQSDTFAKALPSILSVLLTEQPPVSIPPSLETVEGTTTLYRNTAATNLVFTNNGGGQIETCTVSPPLPSGLSAEVTSGGSTCRITGTPSVESSANLYTITATNALGSANVKIFIEVLGSEVQMSGTITFDLIPTRSTGNGLNYNSISQEPAALVTVQLLDINDAVLQTTRTDEFGQFEFNLADERTVRIRVRAELLKDFGDGRYDVRVVDNTNSFALYTLAENTHSSARNNPVRDLHAGSGWNGSSYTAVRAAAPFAMLESIRQSIERVLAVDEDVILPPLLVNWSENNRPFSGNPANGDIGTSFYSNGNLFILGAANSDTDEYDDHVIIHEWGHYFEDKLSRSDSIGGSHSGGQRLDMRVAFGEGFGNAISGIVTDDPIYVDTFGSGQQSGFSINVEENPNDSRRGWYNESSVQSILYDFYDSANDGVDTVSLGFAPIYEVLVNEQRTTPFFTSIFSFTTALRDNNPDDASDIDAIISGQSITAAGISADGSNETNDAGGGANVLPVHQAVTLGLTSNTCVTTTLQSGGTRNKLSNHRFLSLMVPAAGSYSYSVSKTSSTYTTTDPDLFFFRDGSVVHTAISGVPDNETGNVFLSAGLHVIEFSDFEMTTFGSTGTACFDLTLTAL